MVPVVPLFSTEHSKGKILAISLYIYCNTAHVGPISCNTAHVGPISCNTSHVGPITCNTSHVGPISCNTAHVGPISCNTSHVGPIHVVSISYTGVMFYLSFLLTIRKLSKIRICSQHSHWSIHHQLYVKKETSTNIVTCL